MTSRQKLVHERAVSIVSQHRKSEFEVLRALAAAESLKVYRALKHKSLYQYAVKELKLNVPTALTFISVSRKCREVPQLAEALKSGSLCVSKASRIVSVLNRENADELVRLACALSWRELEKEVARRNPRAASPDRIKVLSEKIAQMLVALPVEGVEMFERVLSIEAQRTGKSPSRGDGLIVSFEAYLEKYDPVRKADRAKKRKEKTKHSVRTERIPENSNQSVTYGNRVRLTADERHVVNARDKGQCTWLDEKGQRCCEDRWTDIHHIVRVADGGTNDPSNLRTLCGFHHDLIHQLSLPLDGQVTWLRSPTAPYAKGMVRRLPELVRSTS